MQVKKAGCVLLNLENKEIGLVYRPKRKDFSFPKGHLEHGETLEECAVRETEEETGRSCHIILNKELTILHFSNSIGEDVENYFYLALDDGPVNRKISIEDQEELVWKKVEEVEETLSYQNLKDFWRQIEPIVMEVIRQK